MSSCRTGTQGAKRAACHSRCDKTPPLEKRTCDTSPSSQLQSKKNATFANFGDWHGSVSCYGSCARATLLCAHHSMLKYRQIQTEVAGNLRLRSPGVVTQPLMLRAPNSSPTAWSTRGIATLQHAKYSWLHGNCLGPKQADGTEMSHMFIKV